MKRTLLLILPLLLAGASPHLAAADDEPIICDLVIDSADEISDLKAQEATPTAAPAPLLILLEFDTAEAIDRAAGVAMRFLQPALVLLDSDVPRWKRAARTLERPTDLTSMPATDYPIARQWRYGAYDSRFC